jgi:hypothetical protein
MNRRPRARPESDNDERLPPVESTPPAAGKCAIVPESRGRRKETEMTWERRRDSRRDGASAAPPFRAPFHGHRRCPQKRRPCRGGGRRERARGPWWSEQVCGLGKASWSAEARELGRATVKTGGERDSDQDEASSEKTRFALHYKLESFSNMPSKSERMGQCLIFPMSVVVWEQ